MYPNPQEALPLVSRPDLTAYQELAKELLESCRSTDPAAIRRWAIRWIGRLSTRLRRPKTLSTTSEIEACAVRVADFAREQFSAGTCSLRKAQFVIARAHGFASWPTFAAHLDSLRDPSSTVAAFEAAASAIVNGDAARVRRLLRAHPELARARSTREHGATLLHYVSANGVEGYRQLSPANSGEIAELLLAAGAEVDATTRVYGGRCTALGLVATSAPPFAAGVQRKVIDVLLEHGARVDLRGSVGHDALLVHGCLMNGQPQAAEYLANRGAPLDLESAAGLGRTESVERLIGRAPRRQIAAAFSLACAYGQAAVIEFMLVRGGIAVDTPLKSHGRGHTGLHVAAFHGQLEAVKTLLRHGAAVDAIDKTWKTPPLVWALTGWQRSGHGGDYHQVVAELVAAVAIVTPDLLVSEHVRRDARMRAALRGKRVRRS
jgi:hypothetical protein